MTEAEARQQLVDGMLALEARGLNRGTSGNLSVRHDSGMLITPSGVAPRHLHPAQMVFISADGSFAADGPRPSSEWRMHHRILERRPEVSVVAHCHARHATILACAHKEIPPLHYMVAVSGGARVPLAPYATFGSRELADNVVATLDRQSACLMANHGLIVVGRSVDRVISITEEIEEQAAVYWGTLAIGGPVLLSDAQMGAVLAAFRSYGQR